MFRLGVTSGRCGVLLHLSTVLLYVCYGGKIIMVTLFSLRSHVYNVMQFPKLVFTFWGCGLVVFSHVLMMVL